MEKSQKRSPYNRLRLEDFIEDTIPPIRHVDTEIFFRRVTEETLDFIRPQYGALVLDVASGMGIDSNILCGRDFKVIALDPMGRMLDYSRKHHRKNGHYAMHMEGYAEELPLRDESVDQVLCKGSIDHFVDPRTALAEMRRVLKRGGRFVVAAANYDSLTCRYSRLVDALKKIKYGQPPLDAPRPHYEMPSDHVTRFNARLLRNMVGEFFEIRRETGIGVLWGAPYFNAIWDRLSRPKAEKWLNLLYNAARYLPSIADMTVLDCVKV